VGVQVNLDTAGPRWRRQRYAGSVERK
jgi:hypothetical protein